MNCDTDNDGLLSLRDLIPINFEKATKDQQRNILQYVDSKINKKRKNVDQDCISASEMEQLFCCYDHSGLGFIAIGLIRDRLKTFNLPEAAEKLAMDLFKDIEDDEMVNQSEFLRLLSTYSM